MRKLLVLIAVAAPLALAACGEDDDETTTAATEEATTTTEASGGAAGGGGETVEISETEFALEPPEATVAAGEVTFAVTNDGSTTHNLEVEGSGVEEVSETLEPGASTDLAVQLEQGTYEMYCAIGTHREQGMEGEVTVE
jgi:plastocyanin